VSQVSRTERTLYSILGLSVDAPAAVIKAAYRALAKQYHPDGGGGSAGDADKFIELQEAYKILSDEVSRADYDRYLQNLGGDDANDIPDEEADARIDPDEVWSIKVALNPEIQEIYNILNTYSPALGNRFRLAVIDGECDKDPAAFATVIDREFFGKYFGTNPEVLALARNLLAAGDRKAAKALNKAVQRGEFKDIDHAKVASSIFDSPLKPDGTEKFEPAKKQQKDPKRDFKRAEVPVEHYRESGFWVSWHFRFMLAISLIFTLFFFIIMGFTSADAIVALLRNPVQYSPFLLSLVVVNCIFGFVALSAHRITELRKRLTLLARSSPKAATALDKSCWWFVGPKYFLRSSAVGSVASVFFAGQMGFASTKALADLVNNPMQYLPFLLSLVLINLVFWLLALSLYRYRLAKDYLSTSTSPSLRNAVEADLFESRVIILAMASTLLPIVMYGLGAVLGVLVSLILVLWLMVFMRPSRLALRYPRPLLVTMGLVGFVVILMGLGLMFQTSSDVRNASQQERVVDAGPNSQALEERKSRTPKIFYDRIVGEQEVSTSP
jgi:curved DNA-binding protein CbpA